MKSRAAYRCSECGYSSAKWLGKCPDCGSWNSLNETIIESGGQREERAVRALKVADLPREESQRIQSGWQEFDRVLGGGLTGGATTLIGGEPGVGKSTLMLQIAGALANRTALYVSGEESAGQLRSRAERLSVADSDLHILCATDLGAIIDILNSMRPRVVIIDSAQTLVEPEIGAIPGTPSQLKYCCHALIEWTRSHNASLFLVAHITKEGTIAGPKLVEHIVDTVLYFEQSGGEIRFLRATKNRFGATDEVGLFEMGPDGLRQVRDPNSLFLVRREGGLPPGVALAAIYEGSRVFIIEIQALTVPAKGGISRVFSERIDSGRVARIAAVLEKHIRTGLSGQDIYVNVAGGMRISEIGVELPLAHALYSAYSSIPLPSDAIVVGEVSLAGEVRPVPQLPKRIKTAREMGYTHCIAPPQLRSGTAAAGDWTTVTTLRESIDMVFRRSDGQQ